MLVGPPALAERNGYSGTSRLLGSNWLTSQSQAQIKIFLPLVRY